MAVLAHPDDESLGLGGVLAKYSAEGVETFLVTATRGEGGRFHEHRSGPDHPGRDKLGEIRESELRAAVRALGLQRLWILGYPDGGLDAVDPKPALDRIAGIIRQAKPHVVLTFPPDGAYGHPDHIAICQLASAAVVAAADPAHRLQEDGTGLAPHAVSKLYYFVISGPRMDTYQTVFKKMISTVDGVERLASSWPDWEITTVIDTREYWPAAWKAISCHDSQIAVFEKLKSLPPEQHEALWGRQEFYRAFSTVNGGRQREADLFEGLRR